MRWLRFWINRKTYKGRQVGILMEINGHDEVTGEEIDWACDTADPFGELQEGFCN